MSRARNKRRRYNRALDMLVYLFATIGAVTVIVIGVSALKSLITSQKVVTTPPAITEELLTPNEYSRPQIGLDQINGIVIHYTANPGTSAENNRSYFEGLATAHTTYASSHYIIGLDGEIIQCIPLTEIAYASNDRNYDTVSIECCHMDDSGQFSTSTYASLVHLVAYLMGQYDLTAEDVIRHYDVNGKNCPKYYVEHPEQWDAFKGDVTDYIKEYGERVKRSPGKESG